MLFHLDHRRLDARFGLRQLARSPLVASVAILTLAIGIGLNTAVFSLVHAVLLRPLPYPDSERLVWIAPYDEHFGQDTFASRGDYLVWKQQTHVFERMAAYGTQDLNLLVGGEASQERVASIGGDFWEIRPRSPWLRLVWHPPRWWPAACRRPERLVSTPLWPSVRNRGTHTRLRRATPLSLTPLLTFPTVVTLQRLTGGVARNCSRRPFLFVRPR